MRQRPSLFPFLLINLLVSALTTLAVLWAWNRFIAPVNNACLTNPSSSVPAAGVPTALQNSLPALDAPVIQIEYAVGAGDLNQESLRLSRVGEGDLSLLGWKLSDGTGHEYIFGNISLSKGGAVDLYTRAGTDTAIALYWGQTAAIWKSGMTATLSDWQGNLRAQLTIP